MNKESTQTGARRPERPEALADILVRDLFGGNVPDNVHYRVDGLRRPEDQDVVRVEIGCTAPDGRPAARELTIPLDYPRELLDKALVDLLMEDGSTAPALLEVYEDDEYGNIPYIRYQV